MLVKTLTSLKMLDLIVYPVVRKKKIVNRSRSYAFDTSVEKIFFPCAGPTSTCIP